MTGADSHGGEQMEFSTTSLACFLAVANLGSVAGAAHQLDVAGSVISRNIKRLEDVVGVPLFERSPKGMKLTPAGDMFAAYVRRARLEQHETLANLRRHSKQIEGHIRLSATEGLSLALVPRLVAEFQALHGGVSFDLMARPQPDIFRAVEQGGSDLGITFEGRTGDQVEVLFRETFRSQIVMAPDHPLAQEPEPVPMARIADYPVASSPDTTTRTLQDRVVSMLGQQLRIGIATNSTTGMYSYCRHSLGVNFSCVASYQHMVDSGQLVARDFEGSAQMERRVMLSIMRGRRVPRHLAAFIDHASHRISDLARQTAG